MSYLIWYSRAMDKKLLLTARTIIQTNLYATLATLTPENTPWTSPVFICNDVNYTFYWASGIQSQHSRNIAGNHLISMVIFNSQAAWGEGEGVYICGTAFELTDPSDINDVCQLRVVKSGHGPQTITDYSGPSPRRLYVCKPEAMWINTEAQINGMTVDNRTNIELDQLVQL